MKELDFMVSRCGRRVYLEFEDDWPDLEIGAGTSDDCEAWILDDGAVYVVSQNRRMNYFGGEIFRLEEDEWVRTWEVFDQCPEDDEWTEWSWEELADYLYQWTTDGY